MDRIFEEVLRAGVEALALPVDDAAVARLVLFAERLVTWNRKVNLTAITDPREMAEKHFLDSLVLLPSLAGRGSLLDVGSGAGLPGMAVACARPDLAVTCCDSVGKKVAFVKATAVELGLNVRGIAVRASGDPVGDGLPVCQAVVSRALSDPERWVALGAAEGLRLLGVDQFELPFSRAARAVVRWERAGAVRGV